MSDISESQLNEWERTPYPTAAAAVIGALIAAYRAKCAEVEGLRAACEPLRVAMDARIRAYAGAAMPAKDDESPLYWESGGVLHRFTYGDYRRLAALLTPPEAAP